RLIVSVHWNWFVRCDLGRKSGEPSLSKPDWPPGWVEPPRAEMVMPGMPPLYAGESCTPLKPSSARVFKPNGSCVATELLRPQPRRNSLIMRGLNVRVQPIAAD